MKDDDIFYKENRNLTDPEQFIIVFKPENSKTLKEASDLIKKNNFRESI